MCIYYCVYTIYYYILYNSGGKTYIRTAVNEGRYILLFAAGQRTFRYGIIISTIIIIIVIYSRVVLSNISRMHVRRLKLYKINILTFSHSVHITFGNAIPTYIVYNNIINYNVFALCVPIYNNIFPVPICYNNNISWDIMCYLMCVNLSRNRSVFTLPPILYCCYRYFIVIIVIYIATSHVRNIVVGSGII